MNAAQRLIVRVGFFTVCVAICGVGQAIADGEQQTTSSSGRSVATIGKFLGGAAVGLGMHESGHVIVNLGLDTHPGIRGVSFAGIPFFAITHDQVSSGREFIISSAGFWVQEGVNEILLTRRPRLREERAPLIKGVFAFNVLASIGYAGAAFARIGPDERDTRGIALSADIEEPIAGAAILIPAALDAARYYRPRSRTLAWASRSAKAAAAMLVIRAATR